MRPARPNQLDLLALLANPCWLSDAVPNNRLDREETPFLPSEERLLSRFEWAWQGSGPPNLADYCPGRSNRRLLRKLILIDMEHRAKTGLQPRVEAYLGQFPELQSNDDDLLELVLAELRLRKMKLPDDGLEECLQRFPQLAERLNPATAEDADVPVLAVKGLDEATQRAREVGEIVVVRDNQLVKIAPNGKIEVLQVLPTRKKVTVRTKKIKR